MRTRPKNLFRRQLDWGRKILLVPPPFNAVRRGLSTSRRSPVSRLDPPASCRVGSEVDEKQALARAQHRSPRVMWHAKPSRSRLDFVARAGRDYAPTDRRGDDVEDLAQVLVSFESTGDPLIG